MSDPTATGFRLSPQQRQLWSWSDPAQRSACRVQSVLTISADVAVLDRATNSLVEQYETLRTSFKTFSGMSEPVQIVHPYVALSIPVHDLTSASRDKQTAQLQALVKAARAKDFDLESGPLACFEFAKLGEERTAVVITVSAFCADIVSLRILADELLRAVSFSAEAKPVSHEPLQYADIAEWQNELLTDDEGATGREYWANRSLTHRDTSVVLPDCRNSNQDHQWSQNVVRFALPSNPIVTALATVPGDVKLEFALLTAWFVLLAKLTGKSTISTAVQFDGRSYEELLPAVGLFERYLPMECLVDGSSEFSEVLHAVANEFEQMSEFQEYFDSAATSDSPEQIRTIASGFEWRDARTLPAEDERELSLEYECAPSYPIDLKLACRIANDSIECEIYCRDANYSIEFVQRMAERFATVCEQIAANPRIKTSELRAVGGNELRTLLKEFIKSDFVPNEKELIHNLFERHAENKDVQHLAVVSEDGEISYSELNRRANQLANHLRAFDVGADTLVLLCIDRSVEMLVAILGILKSGAAYVPIDPTYPPERIEFIAKDTHASLVLTVDSLVDALPKNIKPVICLDSDWDEIARAPDVKPAELANPDSLAYVIYTSGSTGTPKGVPVSHRNIVNSTESRISYYEPEYPNFLLLSSFAFDSSLVGIFGTLCRGATLILPDEGKERDVAEIARLIESHRVCQILALPSLYSMLLLASDPGKLATLKNVIVAGESCPDHLVRRHFETLPDVRLFNEYGPSEGTVWSTVYECQKDDSGKQIPIGRPLDHVTLYVLDDALLPVPVGAPGELFLGGAGIVRGYLHREEITNERFIRNPFQPASKELIYRTGDLGRYLSNGDVEFLGRVDNQIKLRGHRIELEEIEETLSSHAGVTDSMVVVWDAAKHVDNNGTDGTIANSPGEQSATDEDQRLVAYYVSSDTSLTAQALRDFLRTQLPAYMVPATFMALSEMPLNANGKKDRNGLPDPGSETLVSASTFVAPRTPVEELMAEIWSSTLRAKKVGIRDDFFDLGGHSIIATLLVSRLREAFQIEIPIRYIFESPTIAELTTRLQSDPDNQKKMEEAAELMARISAISDEEVAAMLQKDLDGEDVKAI